MVTRADVVVIGAGPVGLFAIFQLGMLGIRCHVVDALPDPGGQCTALYPEKPIYDIPAYPSIHAAELVHALMKQAEPFAPVWHLNQRVLRLETHPDGGVQLTTDGGLCTHAQAVVIAAGGGAFGPNRPPLEGIRQYEGTSVFYHIARKEHFAGKRVVIAGGGDSAVDWALLLAPLVEKLYVVHRRDKFRAAPENVSALHTKAQQHQLELVVPYQLHALHGEGDHLHAVEVATMDGEVRRLEAEILLPFFGLAMDMGPIASWGLAAEQHHLTVAPDTLQTSMPGVYAIGDIVHYPGKLKLILCGFSEAAMAAHAIHQALHPQTPLHFEYSTTKGVPTL